MWTPATNRHAVIAQCGVERLQRVDQQVLQHVWGKVTGAQQHIDPDEVLFTIAVPIALQLGILMSAPSEFADMLGISLVEVSCSPDVLLV